MSMAKKKARTGALAKHPREHAQRVVLTPRAQRYCCLAIFFSRVGQSV